MAPEIHEITITSIMGMVVEDTDAIVAGVVSSTTNMLLSSLILKAGSAV
jgi:hypothetical protein